MPRRSPSQLDGVALSHLLRRQSGVVTRRQLFELGGSRADLRRHLRGRDLVQLHPGTYVTHTGPPTRAQREWAAVLFYAPAALHRESALAAHGMTQDRERVHLRPVRLMVESGRHLRPVDGVELERVRDMARWVLPHRSPPRARPEFALLKAAADRDESGAVALLSDAVHQGLTTPDRLVDVLLVLTRLPRRRLLLEVLRDVAAGTRSVLERRYLVEVERAHQLPVGERQVREETATGTVHRDVHYRREATLVELDGAFGHRDSLDHWRDLRRDVQAAAGGVLTVRAGWAQVMEPCRLGAVLNQILRARGWAGGAVPCRPDCLLSSDHGSPGPT